MKSICCLAKAVVSFFGHCSTFLSKFDAECQSTNNIERRQPDSSIDKVNIRLLKYIQGRRHCPVYPSVPIILLPLGSILKHNIYAFWIVVRKGRK